MQAILDSIGGYLWGPPMIISIMAVGLFLTIRSKFFGFRFIRHAFKHTLGTITTKENTDKSKGGLSPFEAICIAIGGAVGVGAIGGVSAAIAVGGPGAVFWMWVWGFFGMTVKMVEVSLACYYRSQDEKGRYFGGPSYYMQKGLGMERGWQIGFVLAALFGVTFIANAFSASQIFTISEALNVSFHIPRIPIAIAYSALIAYLIWKGTPRIAKFASRCVPFMCILYLLAGIIMVVINIKDMPEIFRMIFTQAFVGGAPLGGFVGASVMQIIKTGIARSINSNEAGQGSSPQIHASANTIHPVRQGLWGVVEVFVDTMLVCTVTAMAILSTGVWNCGLTGATLAIEAFRVSFGEAGVAFIGLIVFLFGITTTTGWYSYYCSIIINFFRNNLKLRNRALAVFKVIFPLPGIIVVSAFVLTGSSANLFWSIIDIVTVLPTFFNVLALALLSGDFIRLLNDYKARYLNIGKVDPNFHIFYDDGIKTKKGFQMNPTKYAKESELLYKGKTVQGMSLKPESMPIFLTSAFEFDDLTAMKQGYQDKAFTYIRTRNPTRMGLEEMLSFLENGEKTHVLASGMGAITSTLMSIVQAGDHILCNSNIYGETFDVITRLLLRFGVQSDLISFEDPAQVNAAIKPNTKLLYTEVISNPTLSLCDISAVAQIAHKHGALLMVDNTFTTPLAIRPLDFGADIVINSLTKFLNGHNDVMAGSVTASEKLIDSIIPVSMLCGTPGDPFTSWMVMRGLQTVSLRVPRQMENAAKLASELQKHPVVSKVNYPGLDDYSQKELAHDLFRQAGFGAMVSFIVPEHIDKMDEFLHALHFAHYAPTLGGICTTIQHPVTSSHSHVPDDVRRKMGITPGLFRISVGIENIDDLLEDFTQAMKVFQ